MTKTLSLEDIPEVNYDIQAKGLNCPVPQQMVRTKMRKMLPGETLELIATDPAADSEITTWANNTGNTYHGHIEKEPGVYHLYITKV